jgi:hypothetical protein
MEAWLAGYLELWEERLQRFGAALEAKRSIEQARHRPRLTRSIIIH